MNPSRRDFLQWTACATALPAMPSVTYAQSFPHRPVRWIVPSAAGGPLDIVVRLLSQRLSERLGQAFVVENRTGAGGMIGAEAAAKAPADGYTILQIGNNFAINASLYQKADFNFLRDIAPVAHVMSAPLVMVVNPSFPARTVPDFIAYAKAHPNTISFASAGSGTPQHASGELFKMMTGVSMVHVPYRGAPAALTDLISGQVQLIFETMPPSIEHIRSGRLRVLAVTSNVRSQVLPNIPCLSDFVPGYESGGWQGASVPRGTPAEIIAKLNTEINAVLADPSMRRRLADLGGTVSPLAPAEFERLVTDETEKWAKVVAFAGIKPE
jgi:tripartite-type tricarboxylate transporter receptor subunit TctC